jgi:hypothetical protein
MIARTPARGVSCACTTDPAARRALLVCKKCRRFGSGMTSRLVVVVRFVVSAGENEPANFRLTPLVTDGGAYAEGVGARIAAEFQALIVP